MISNKKLREFAADHPAAATPLQDWRRIIEASTFENYAALKKAFNAVDRVDPYHIFDIAGNRYRIIASIHFNTQVLYIRNVFTHTEYNKWNKSR